MRAVSATQEIDAGWARPTVILVASAATAHALALLGALVVARLYAPSDLGAAAAFLSVVLVVSAVSALRYDAALALPREERAAAALLLLCLGLVCVTAAVAGAIAIALGPVLIEALGAPRGLAALRWVVPLAIAAFGISMVLQQWATRERRYGLLARTRVAQVASLVGVQAGLGVAGAGAVGLAVGAMAGGAGGLVRLARSPRQVLRDRRVSADRPPLGRVALRYRRFPLLSTLAALCQGLAVGGAPLLLAALYGLRVAGLYALAQRVAAAPMRVIGEAIGRIYLGDSALMARESPASVRPRLRRTARALMLLAAVPTATLLAAGPSLFAAVFGDAWGTAGEYARPLTILFMAQFVAAPLQQTLNVFERLHLQAGLALGRLVLISGSLLVAHAAGASPLTAIAAMSVGGALAYAAGLLASDRAANVD